MENIVIDKIDTKAMENALLQGQTPFALYKPAKGIPVLVRVSPLKKSKHVKFSNFVVHINIKILVVIDYSFLFTGLESCNR